MKKILALDQGEHVSGAELFFSDLLTRASRHFTIHLITGDNAVYQKMYQHSSVFLHTLELPSLKPVGLRSYKKYRQARKKIEKLIEDFKPDLILSNTVRTHLLASSLAKKKKIPLIWMAHDRTFPQLLLKWFGRYPQQIISCSHFVQSHYQKAIRKRKNLDYQHLFPFGMEEKQIERYKNVPKAKTIGMVGKFIPWKGQDLFLEAAEKIHQTHPEYRFEIIGAPFWGNRESEAFYEKCKQLIHERGLEKVITLKEEVSEVFSHLASWQILVHCSREPEPLGRVVLEGMAMKCAVIASALGGPKEVIEQEKDGKIVLPTVKAIQKAVMDLLEHSNQRMAMAEAAQKKVKEYFLWPQVMEKFEAILKKIS